MSLDVCACLKACQLAAAFTFFAGVLGAAVFLASGDGSSNAAQRAMHRWDQRVTTPAMLLVWAMRLTLAISGVWFKAGWLMAKLVFVVPFRIARTALGQAPIVVSLL